MVQPAEESFAYGSVLKALSRGLYPDKRHIIREFVQNSYDGLYELRKTHPRELLRPVEVKVEPPSIFITDFGIGMPERKMREYRYLGYSEKNPAEHAGFRGIGKYSGLAVAEKIIVDSSPYGIPKRYSVVIHVGDMIDALDANNNIPLEELLKQFTELNEGSESSDEHYTFVELHTIRKDGKALFEKDVLKHYLTRTAPIPFNPEFKFAAEIERKLAENIPDYLAVELSFNGEKIYKPHLPRCREPEYETVLYQDDKPDILAFSWYCQNEEKGQFDPKENSGLVYRVKNIAVGDGQLTRRTLWHSTPERAFYFFGEIHVLDPQVIPSSDRTDFEDVEARRRLYQRSVRIASILSHKAGEESARRRFQEVVTRGNEVLSERGRELVSGTLPLELKDQVVFEVQKFQEDVQNRLEKSKDERAKNRAQRFLSRSRKFLSGIRKDGRGFFNLQKALKFDRKLRLLYDTIIEILKDEFLHEPGRLEHIVRRIHDAIKAKGSR
ncbi:ATP-binding protein [Candidatus Uhrbacteria bacterium]|nr:ATP-binding protein [Candidatus Uhrbacteria bacterium]